MGKLFNLCCLGLFLILLHSGCVSKFSDDGVWLYRYDRVMDTTEENIPADQNNPVMKILSWFHDNQ